MDWTKMATSGDAREFMKDETVEAPEGCSVQGMATRLDLGKMSDHFVSISAILEEMGEDFVEAMEEEDMKVLARQVNAGLDALEQVGRRIMRRVNEEMVTERKALVEVAPGIMYGQYGMQRIIIAYMLVMNEHLMNRGLNFGLTKEGRLTELDIAGLVSTIAKVSSAFQSATPDMVGKPINGGESNG